jgi:hypothetical protein
MHGFVDVGHPLWREVVSVVYSCCWASQAQSFLGPSSACLMTMFLLSQIWDSPKLEGQLPVFISPSNRIVQLYPQASLVMNESFLPLYSLCTD